MVDNTLQNYPLGMQEAKLRLAEWVAKTYLLYQEIYSTIPTSSLVFNFSNLSIPLAERERQGRKKRVELEKEVLVVIEKIKKFVKLYFNRNYFSEFDKGALNDNIRYCEIDDLMDKLNLDKEKIAQFAKYMENFPLVKEKATFLFQEIHSLRPDNPLNTLYVEKLTIQEIYILLKNEKIIDVINNFSSQFSSFLETNLASRLDHKPKKNYIDSNGSSILNLE